MMTGLLYLIVLVAAVGLIKVIYWLVISFALTEEPRGGEVHMLTTGDDWKIRLVRFRSKQGEGEPVLLCHGAFGNHWNLCSPAGHSMADVLSELGYDCWLIDLRGSRSSLAPLGKSRFDATFDDYLQHDLPEAIDFIRKTTGFRRVHWVGHSMGGMLLYAYELVHGPKYIASGTTLGSPPGFAGVDLRGKGLVARLAHSQFSIKAYRHIPSAIELGLRFVAPFIPLFKIGNPLAPTNWTNMHPDVGSTTYFNMLELLPPNVAAMMLEASARNQWKVNDGTIDVVANLNRLVTPLFCIYAIQDPFVPRANAEAFYAGLPSTDKDFLMLSKANGALADYNHVDLAFARNGRVEVCEPIAKWIARHSSRDKLTITDAAGVYVPPVAVAANDDASWRKALRRAADVLTDLDGENDGVAARKAAARVQVDALDSAASLARGLGSAPVKKKAAPKKKAAAAKKTAPVKVNGAKKPESSPASAKAKPTTTKAKATPKKKAAAKKPALKKKSSVKPASAE